MTHSDDQGTFSRFSTIMSAGWWVKKGMHLLILSAGENNRLRLRQLIRIYGERCGCVNDSRYRQLIYGN